MGRVPVTPVEAVSDVVEAARAAQPAWAALGHEGRAALLREASAAFRERADELGRLVTREMGKPLSEGIGEARSLASGVDQHLDEIRDALAPETFDDGRNVSTGLPRPPRSLCGHHPLELLSSMWCTAQTRRGRRWFPRTWT